MYEKTPSTRMKAQGDLEATMQRVSLIVSAVGLGLMIAGFVATLIIGASSSIPGDPVLPFSRLVYPSQAPVSMVAMSAGIVLLTLLPAIRTLLALWLYLRHHSVLNALVALIVFVELLLSIRAGN
ncbi:MAG: hypothetical protein Kow0063_31140 [Anaerolineae bacterium]